MSASWTFQVFGPSSYFLFPPIFSPSPHKHLIRSISGLHCSVLKTFCFLCYLHDDSQSHCSIFTALGSPDSSPHILLCFLSFSLLHRLMLRKLFPKSNHVNYKSQVSPLLLKSIVPIPLLWSKWLWGLNIPMFISWQSSSSNHFLEISAFPWKLFHKYFETVISVSSAPAYLPCQNSHSHGAATVSKTSILRDIPFLSIWLPVPPLAPLRCMTEGKEHASLSVMSTEAILPFKNCPHHNWNQVVPLTMFH